MTRTYKAFACLLAEAASEKKGQDIALLQLGRKDPLADYMLLVSALSRPHLETLENVLEDAAGAFGIVLAHRSRPKSDQWRVLDFGRVIVHLMSPEAREFYSLEKLHHAAPRLRWEKPAGSRTPAAGARHLEAGIEP